MDANPLNDVVPDEIHTAAFKSYRTTTPNGFNRKSAP